MSEEPIPEVIPEPSPEEIILINEAMLLSVNSGAIYNIRSLCHSCTNLNDCVIEVINRCCVLTGESILQELINCDNNHIIINYDTSLQLTIDNGLLYNSSLYLTFAYMLQPYSTMNISVLDPLITKYS